MGWREGIFGERLGGTELRGEGGGEEEEEVADDCKWSDGRKLGKEVRNGVTVCVRLSVSVCVSVLMFPSVISGFPLAI